MNIVKSIYRNIVPSLLREKIYKIRMLLQGTIFIAQKDSYNEDGFATNHISDFLNDKIFIQNYNEAAKGTNHKAKYRAYILNYFAEYALKLFENRKDGCFIELGTEKGLMAKIVILNTNLKKRGINFFLFDTFEGIPLDNILKSEIKHVNHMNKNVYNKNVYEFIKEKFKDYPFVKPIKGKLPQTLNQENINLQNIQFMHIDLNNAYSEIESIKLLYDKLLPGAVVVLDDYCYAEAYRPQKDAWDDFIKTKNTKILSLPTGQGVFFKI